MGCDENDDRYPNGRPISGDSTLIVDNPTKYQTTVTFDDLYLGTVDSHAQRTWSVPSGTYVVELTRHISNSETNPERASGPHNFEAGHTTTLTASWSDNVTH